VKEKKETHTNSQTARLALFGPVFVIATHFLC
jgi:hypothetical protein